MANDEAHFFHIQRSVPTGSFSFDSISCFMCQSFSPRNLHRLFPHVGRSKSLQWSGLHSFKCISNPVPEKSTKKTKCLIALWRGAISSFLNPVHPCSKKSLLSWGNPMGFKKPIGLKLRKGVYYSQRASPQPSSNPKGFALFFLILILPFCLSAFLGLLYVGTLFTKINELNSNCQKIYLSAQNQLSIQLEALIRLNTPARRLLNRKARAQKQLATGIATGNVKLIAKAKTELAVIRVEQIKLRSQQQYFLTQAQLISKKSHLRLRNLLSRNQGLVVIGSIATLPYGLSVNPRPANEIAPYYEIPHNFEDLQKSEAKWSIDPLALMPPPLHFFMESTLRIQPYKMSCSATLRERRQKWHAHLSRVRA